MDAAARSRLVGWLFLLGPAGSLILFVLGMTVLGASGLGEALEGAISGVSARWLGANPFFAAWSFAMLGWLLLTLGCSAGTCLRAFRRQGKSGTALVVYMLLATPMLAFAHVAAIGAVAWAGCMVVIGFDR